MAGAISRRQATSPSGSRAKNTITATEGRGGRGDDPDPAGGAQPEEQVGHRRPPAQGVDEDDGHAGRALRQGRGAGDVAGAGAAERGGEAVLPGQGGNK